MAGSIQAGDLTRLPVAGMEGRTMEVCIKPSRAGTSTGSPTPSSQSRYGCRASPALSITPMLTKPSVRAWCVLGPDDPRSGSRLLGYAKSLAHLSPSDGDETGLHEA